MSGIVRGLNEELAGPGLLGCKMLDGQHWLGKKDHMNATLKVGATSAIPSNGGSADSKHVTTTTCSLPSGERVLSDERLARFASRAAGYDRENRFFEED